MRKKSTGEVNDVGKRSAGEEYGKSIKGRQGKFGWILDCKESSNDTLNKFVLTRVLDGWSI